MAVFAQAREAWEAYEASREGEKRRKKGHSLEWSRFWCDSSSFSVDAFKVRTATQCPSLPPSPSPRKFRVAAEHGMYQETICRAVGSRGVSSAAARPDARPTLGKDTDDPSATTPNLELKFAQRPHRVSQLPLMCRDGDNCRSYYVVVWFVLHRLASAGLTGDRSKDICCQGWHVRR